MGVKIGHVYSGKKRRITSTSWQPMLSWEVIGSQLIAMYMNADEYMGGGLVGKCKCITAFLFIILLCILNYFFNYLLYLFLVFGSIWFLLILPTHVFISSTAVLRSSPVVHCGLVIILYILYLFSYLSAWSLELRYGV